MIPNTKNAKYSLVCHMSVALCENNPGPLRNAECSGPIRLNSSSHFAMEKLLLILNIEISVLMSIETRPQFFGVKYPKETGLLPRWGAHLLNKEGTRGGFFFDECQEGTYRQVFVGPVILSSALHQ